jgi:hypothetical protein
MARTVVENSGDGYPMQQFHQNRRNPQLLRKSEAAAFPPEGRQPSGLPTILDLREMIEENSQA